MSVVLLKHHYDAKDFFLIYMFTMPKRSATVYLGLKDLLKGGGGGKGVHALNFNCFMELMLSKAERFPICIYLPYQ